MDPRVPIDRESGNVTVDTNPTAIIPLTNFEALDHAVLVVKNTGGVDLTVTWVMSHDGVVVDERPADGVVCRPGRSVTLPLDSDAMMIPWWGANGQVAAGSTSTHYNVRIRRLS